MHSATINLIRTEGWKMHYELNEIDKLEIFVLMDNISDPFTDHNNNKIKVFKIKINK